MRRIIINYKVNLELKQLLQSLLKVSQEILSRVVDAVNPLSH